MAKSLRLLILLTSTLCCWLIIPMYANAQTLDQHLSADSLKAGDVFHFSIVLKKDRDYDKILYPDSSNFSGVFEMRSRKTYRIADFKDSLDYHLQFWATQDTTLPALPVKLIDGSDTTTIYTKPIPIKFRSVLASDKEKLRPLKPIYNFAAAWWPYIVGFVVLLLAATLIYYLYINYWNEPEAQETVAFTPRPFLNPLKELENNLRQLQDLSLTTNKQFEQFYISIGDAIRIYIKQMYEIPAMESSTREIIYELNRRAVDKKLIQQSRVVFREADLVKFANFEATEQQAQESLAKAQTFYAVAKELHEPRVRQMKRQHEAQVEQARKAFNEKQKQEKKA